MVLARSALATLLCTLWTSTVQGAPANQIHSEGYGPVRVGMTAKEAERALGVGLKIEDFGGCAQATPASGHAGVSFTLLDGRIARASAHSEKSLAQTPRGVGIGAPAATVRQLYGPRLKESPHAYGAPPDDYYLDYWVTPQRGVRFEVEGGRISFIHGGDRSIQLVEGCL